ncbi:MAG: hypothetical protein D6812_12855 [Deltaproteobacteria bacterium]|nr:MAG: hypothetical protein D6812_12855 [Deltaproteobacteria bacterium]
MATGLFFGWMPAKRAAELGPLEALRFEWIPFPDRGTSLMRDLGLRTVWSCDAFRRSHARYADAVCIPRIMRISETIALVAPRNSS